MCEISKTAMINDCDPRHVFVHTPMFFFILTWQTCCAEKTKKTWGAALGAVIFFAILVIVGFVMGVLGTIAFSKINNRQPVPFTANATNVDPYSVQDGSILMGYTVDITVRLVLFVETFTNVPLGLGKIPAEFAPDQDIAYITGPPDTGTAQLFLVVLEEDGTLLAFPNQDNPAQFTELVIHICYLLSAEDSPVVPDS
jgi:hypothetical protein